MRLGNLFKRIDKLKIGKQKEENMPKKNVKGYVYNGWTLYTRGVTLRGGRNQTIYFFSKRTLKSGTPCPLPKGYEVRINHRTGLPYLAQIGSPEIVKPIEKPTFKQGGVRWKPYD